MSAAPVAPARREVTKQANRAAILAAARAVFADLGYGAAGCATSSGGTELATGTFYNYFPDKEAVFRALLEESATEARAARPARPAAGRDAGGVRGRRLPRLLRRSWPGTHSSSTLVRRNAGTISTQFAGPAFGLSVSELEEDLRAAPPVGGSTPTTSPTWPPRWWAPPSRSGWR